ncbi:ATP-binding protein [Streptomyces sp. NBC_01136]|nr:ATP-binding protein [Streptomyces sp. NBC_01136]
MAVVAWQVGQIPAGQLVGALACGTAAAALVGAHRAKAAATVVQGAQAAELQKITGATNAVEKSVLWTADELCRGGRPSVPDSLPPTGGTGLAAEIEVLLGELQLQAVASLIRVHDESQSAVLLEMLRQLSRREHALVGRGLEALTELQALTDDPELLDKIYKIDHLVTRMRRLVESKAVLGGESLRSVRRPVNVVTVLRGAVSEVVQFPRVAVAAGTVGAELALPGHVGPDLTHLLAELIENACDFSDPNTKVQVRAQRVAKGLAIEVEDRALPMSPQLRAKMNRALAEPDRVDVSAQVRDGHIGLLTAAKIAQRHGMSVTLSENSTGGTTALVVVPTRQLVAIPSGAARTTAPPPAPGQPSPAAPAQPQSAPPATAIYAQSAHAERRETAPTPDIPGRPAGAPPLPQRTRGQLRIPDAAQKPQAPAKAARPGLAAAFRVGMHSARTQKTTAPAPSPQAAGRGEPPAAHL